MNKAILVGRLVRDLEIRRTNKDKAVASGTIAIDQRFKDANGEKKTDFINIVIWGAQAESSAKYVGKGSQIGVVGRIQTRSYEANDGTKRYVTEVVCDEVEFLGSSGQRASQPKENTDSGFDMDDFQPLDDDGFDSLPF